MRPSAAPSGPPEFDTGRRRALAAADSPVAPGELDAAVLRAQEGSETAFVQLYRAVQPGLLRYLGTLADGHAEDVASETWVQVSRDLKKFHGNMDNFRGWVTTIGRNRALDHLRAQSRRPASPVAPEDLYAVVGERDTADDAMEAMSTGTAVALISALPPEQAEAVMLRVVMGLSAKAAGQVLGKQPGAVRTLTYRGLKTLAARLDRSEL